MASGQHDSAQKRSSADDDELPSILVDAPAAKKRRQSSKRVSFGGEQIKLFDSNEHIGADLLNSSPEPARRVGQRRNASPHPIARRGLAFDDDDTITMSGVPQLPRTSTSGLHDFDEYMFGRDTTAPRFSVLHGGDAAGAPYRHSLDGALSSPEDDITLKLSPANDIDDMVGHHAPDELNTGLLDGRDSDAELADSAHKSAPPSVPRSAPRPSPTGARLQTRQSLPENRQLFSNENEEEDVTIHYDTPSAKKPPTGIMKKPSRSMPAPQYPPSSLKSPNVRTASRQPISTPQSALGSKIRAAAHELSATRDTVTVEHSINELALVTKFLDSAGVGLHFNVSRVAVTPTKPAGGVDNFDMSTLGGQVGACVTKTAVVDELENACVSLQRMVEDVHAELDKLSNAIETTPPDIVKMVSDDVSLSPGARNVVQTGLKRLRRQATMHAGLDWVRGREGRERRIEGLVGDANKTLDKEVDDLSRQQALLMTRIEEVKEKLGDVGDADSMSEPVDTELKEKLQAALRGSSVARRRWQESRSKEEVLTEKMSELLSGNRELEKKCNDSRRHLTSGSASKMEMTVADMRKRSRFCEYMLGIRTIAASSRRLEIRLAGIADVSFTLDGSAVGMNVQPCVEPGNGLPDAMFEFLNDVVSRCAGAVSARTVGDIPVVVHLMTEFFTLARQSCLEAAQYLDRHDLEFLDAPYNAEKETSDLVINARYFCVGKRVKFAAVFNVSHFPPVFEKGRAKLGGVNVAVTSVEQIIGTPPPVGVVQGIVVGCRGLRQKMTEVGSVFGKG